jgi:predicted tellurium resistance membrane protein TerC
MKLTSPVFTILSNDISGRDLILIIGGLFLLAKSTHEIHQKLEGTEEEMKIKKHPSFRSVIIQIILLDIVFSLDSVITAIGMVDKILIMVLAVIIAVGFMMLFSKAISIFIDEHPTIKMLALSFLILIGVSLIAEGLEQHIPKGYIYFSMAFSIFVEMLNIKTRTKKVAPIKLKNSPRLNQG